MEVVKTKLLDCIEEENQLAEMLACDLDNIYNELNKKVQQGELEDYERNMLWQLMWNVGAQVFRKMPILQERLVNTMGGQVLEFDWDIEYRKLMSEARAEGLHAGKMEGRMEGRLEGRMDGENRKLATLICRKLSKGKSVEIIAEELDEEIEVVSRICEIVKEYAPNYDVDQICERMRMVVV